VSKISFTETRTVTLNHEIDLSQPHWWKVTTEGDIEGRTIRDLGLHHGTLQEVADKLAGQCSWVLSFRWINPNEPGRTSPRKPSEVTISVDGIPSPSLRKALVESGTSVTSAKDARRGVTIKLR